jgi:cytochrome c5
MADGLLSDVLGAIDRQKQRTKASLGLLFSNPQEWAAQAVEQTLPTRSEEQQYRDIKKSGGDIWNTPYMQKLFNMSQIQSQIAYHGSPYNFDKFNLKKIGAGEGNQSYGHGMYFAEAPEVAQSYIAAGQATKAPNRETEMVARALDATGGDKTKAMAWLQSRLATSPQEFKDIYSKAINGFDALMPKGGLYKVDIPDTKVKTFIDWDTKLSKQKNASKIVDTLNKQFGFGYDTSYTGGDLYKALTADFMSTNSQLSPMQAQKIASDTLNSLGIQGIKYFDQASRGAKQGTRNYVVFDPTDVKILSKETK